MLEDQNLSTQGKQWASPDAYKIDFRTYITELLANVFPQYPLPKKKTEIKELFSNEVKLLSLALARLHGFMIVKS